MSFLSIALALAPLAAPLHSDADPWDVEAQRGRTSPLEFTATEGTWISVDVSPDGTLLAFDLLGHVYTVPVVGGAATARTSGRSWNSTPRWSPDGTELLMTSDRGGSEDLWVLSLATGELENVTQQPLPVFLGNYAGPHVGDGRQVIGTSLDMRVRFPVNLYNRLGSHQELIGAGGRNPLGPFVPHPVERVLYFEHQDGRYPADGPRIKRFDLETGEIETVVRRPGGGAAPALSPDGAFLAYVHREDKQNVLVVRELETRRERVVASGLDRGRFESTHFYGAHPALDWHPDGRRIFYSAGGGLRSVDVESGAVTEIPFEAPVARVVEETLRFPVAVPDRETRTRSHRWATRTAEGIVFEALGDLWIRAGGAPRLLAASPDHLTNPLVDEAGGRLFCATWNDADLGAIAVLPLTGGQPERLTSFPSQYGSLALSPDGLRLAYLRGDGALAEGVRLEDQTTFALCALDLATREETVVTDVTWTGNRYAKRPPSVRWSPDGTAIHFTEFEADVLVLKRVRADGLDERSLVRFPHATRAVLSPDLTWIAFREYHRTFVTPFEFAGALRDVSAADGKGFARRVSSEWDGDFVEWTADSARLAWVRGPWFCETRLEDVLAELGPVERTDLSIEFEVARPAGRVAFTGVTVLTMDAEDRVLEDVTLLVEGERIAAVGADVTLPADTRVIDATGQVVMPGMFDAHGHYGSPLSALNVIEQRQYGLRANLAYGVTTMMDVYGTTQKDFWLSDMLRAGRVEGPRIFSVGDPMFVTKYRTKMHRPISSLDDAIEHARFNQDHGAVALKDYSNHTRAARQQLAEACRRLELNLVTESFGTPAMNFTQLLDGFTGLEHTVGLTPLYDDVLRLFAATDAGLTATLVVLYGGPSGEQWFHARERLWEDEKLLNFYRSDQLLRLRRPTHHFDDDWYHPEMVRSLADLRDAGVLLTMGAHGQMMGLGAHWEMELFVQGGFTPLETIRVATINGFRHHGLDAELGSIEPGKFADFVLLRADPREDIRNTRAIANVVKNGVVYSGADSSRVHPEPQPFESLYFQAGD